ncbi:DUF805 domain-containing protein [Falsihalocynthiibacter sp. SS001]|uniref:DUF805 domain-containing protein n=1 Tax=Falsihalocynthiibacter sp. SS001 TaxID=3349698 RepID=UPI0036D266DD
MLTAIRTVLSKYATFTGRATRSEFWWWVLAFMILLLVTNLIDRALFGAPVIEDASPSVRTQPVSTLAAIALFIPHLAVSVRRLHDISKSGWWLLISLVPIVGALVLLYFYTRPSDAGSNDFGAPNPLPADG